MKKCMLFAILLVVHVSRAFADDNHDMSTSCDTQFDAASPPVVSFFGDSLGDYVDKDFYGVFGWTGYLTNTQPARTWNVQNLAKEGWKTTDVFDNIQKCSHPDYKAAFQLSNHVAFEIGGNDVKDVGGRDQVNGELVRRGVTNI